MACMDSADAPLGVNCLYDNRHVTFVALAQETPVVWVSYVPLFPLALLLITGLYLFVLPYAGRWRSGRRSEVRTAGLE